jgi:ribonuclease-3
LPRLFSWFTKASKKKNRKDRREGRSENLLELESVKFKALENILGAHLDYKSYYVQALTHRSYLESNEFNGCSNERLEFLGDSVLSLIVAQYLFENFPDEDEGFLTKLRSRFVNRNSLADAAEDLGVAELVILGNNIQRSFVKNSKTVLADALEALIGAMYLDRGLEACREFIIRSLINPKIQDDEYLIDENYKSQLLEYTQANKISPPVYEVINEEGPHHERTFTVWVSVNDIEMGVGKGKNKKTAEQNAARIALKKIRSSVGNKDPG